MPQLIHTIYMYLTTIRGIPTQGGTKAILTASKILTTTTVKCLVNLNNKKKKINFGAVSFGVVIVNVVNVGEDVE